MQRLSLPGTKVDQIEHFGANLRISLTGCMEVFPLIAGKLQITELACLTIEITEVIILRMIGNTAAVKESFPLTFQMSKCCNKND